MEDKGTDLFPKASIPNFYKSVQPNAIKCLSSVSIRSFANAICCEIFLFGPQLIKMLDKEAKNVLLAAQQISSFSTGTKQ